MSPSIFKVCAVPTLWVYACGYFSSTIKQNPIPNRGPDQPSLVILEKAGPVELPLATLVTNSGLHCAVADSIETFISIIQSQGLQIGVIAFEVLLPDALTQLQKIR